MRTPRTSLAAPVAALVLASLPLHAQAPAQPEKPLPYVAVVPFAPAATVKPPQAHLGTLVAVLLEQAALSSPDVNVVTQGAQAEMLDDMGVKAGAPLEEDTARRLAQLSGASHVLYGTYEAGEGAALTFKVRVFGVLAGASRDLATVSGQPADVVARLAEALGRDLAVQGMTAPVPPATDKAQKGYVACVTFTAVALERAAVKGRKVSPPKGVMASCKDAATDKASAPSQGVMLAARLLTGDAKAAAELQKHVDANPSDRLAGLVMLRKLFDDAAYDDAAALLKKIKAARPRDPDVLRMAGELEVQKDSWEAARFDFQQAANQAPNSPYLRYRLSYASYRTDNPKDALEHARQALRLAGGDAPFYELNLGERLLDGGQTSEAILQLERAVKANPNRLTPRVRLGYAHLLAGDGDAALQELTAAEKIPPTEREAERGIDALLKIDLARAQALKGNDKDAMKQLKAMEKAGLLEKKDLEAPEFARLRATPEFKKLKAL